MTHRELRPHLCLHPEVLGDGSPLLVLLGHDGELEPLVVLEQGEHAGGDLGVRRLHPREGGVPAHNTLRKHLLSGGGDSSMDRIIFLQNIHIRLLSIAFRDVTLYFIYFLSVVFPFAPVFVRDLWVAAPVADHGAVLAGRHRRLHVAARTLGPDECRHVVADVVHLENHRYYRYRDFRYIYQDGVRAQHVPLGVVILEVQLDAGQQRGAVVDLLHRVLDGAGDGEALHMV